MDVKQGSVRVMRRLRQAASRSGLLGFLERRSEKRFFVFLRSFFSIYDFEDMVQLGLPWWAFSVTQYIDDFLLKHAGRAHVFEYGPGASTLWLAKRAHRVAFVEHDEQFMHVLDGALAGYPNVMGILRLPEKVGPNAKCRSACKGYEGLDFSRYVKSIRLADGPFDLIVIDGRARVACLEEAQAHLKPNGIILFDNSIRKRHRAAIRNVDMGCDPFRGLESSLPYPDETTILGARIR